MNGTQRNDLEMSKEFNLVYENYRDIIFSNHSFQITVCFSFHLKRGETTFY